MTQFNKSHLLFFAFFISCDFLISHFIHLQVFLKQCEMWLNTHTLLIFLATHTLLIFLAWGRGEMASLERYVHNRLISQSLYTQPMGDPVYLSCKKLILRYNTFHLQRKIQSNVSQQSCHLTYCRIRSFKS